MSEKIPEKGNIVDFSEVQRSQRDAAKQESHLILDDSFPILEASVKLNLREALTLAEGIVHDTDIRAGLDSKAYERQKAYAHAYTTDVLFQMLSRHKQDPSRHEMEVVFAVSEELVRRLSIPDKNASQG